MRRAVAVIALLAAAMARGGEPVRAGTGVAVGAVPPMIEQDGQAFQLASSTSTSAVDTDEYVLAGEKLADWTQLLTVQRLKLAQAAGTDEFLAYFRKRVAADGASVDVLKQSPAVSVFAVRFPKSERNDEQVMICLAFCEPARPAALNIVQYAIKPARAAVAVVEMRIRTWRDRFLREAAVLAPAAGADAQ